MNKILLGFLALITFGFLNPPDAQALSCVRTGLFGFIGKVQSAEFIFEGYVADVVESTEPTETILQTDESEQVFVLELPAIEDIHPGAKPYQVNISKIWKGEVPNEVTVYGGGLWQQDIEVGNSYLFAVSNQKEGNLYLGSQCLPSAFSRFWGRILLFSNILLFVLVGLIAVGIGLLVRKKMKK